MDGYFLTGFFFVCGYPGDSVLYIQLSGKKVKLEEVKSIRITGYSRVLRKLIQRRWLVIGMAVLLLIVTGLLTPFIGTEFMPRAESKTFTAVVKMPEGTQMERTSAAVGNLEECYIPSLAVILYVRYTVISEREAVRKMRYLKEKIQQ